VTLRVLGIDPGLTRCGVGVVEVDGKAPKAVKSLALGPIKFTHQQLEKVRRAVYRIELR